MLKQVSYFRRRADLSAEAFREYWLGTHADIVRGLPGVVRYVQNHATGSVIGGDDPPFHGAAEVWFESLDAMRANVGSDALARIREDEKNFIDLDSMDAMVATEYVIIDGTPTAEDRKIVGLVKAQAQYTPEAFQQAYRNEIVPMILRVPGIPRYAQSHSRLGIYSRTTPQFDAVAELWLAADGSAQASEEMAEVQAFESGLIDLTRTQVAWVEPHEIAL